MTEKVKVVQCWDDGISADIRLTDILRRHSAKATFNINAGLHGDDRMGEWEHKGTKVIRMGWQEMKEALDGFVIANHSLSHPHLEQLSYDKIIIELAEGRERLQQFFQQDVRGFAYPFGSYNEEVIEALRETGHIYARTCKNVENVFPPENPMEFHSNCHFLASDFLERYEKAKEFGVFYFWGHSYEMISENMWVDFENNIKHISDDPESSWADVQDLF
ncbi:MAG: polysaccharide deacetylase family protein [Kiritimatiellae bacterium]|jgi:peptidoglycan/xylan/chitin deacetylase (PgdA/CDA1 family)|nr:polysaccharide deacetylase family protein [Kiritimatiellia bacterium]